MLKSINCLIATILFCAASNHCVAQNIVLGPVLGAVTDSSAKIFIRTNQPGIVTIDLHTDTSFTAPLSFSDTVDVMNDTSVFIYVSGLLPNTKYFYRVWVNQVQDSLTGYLHTFPAQEGHYSFTFGSCLKMGVDSMFEVMKAHNPRFFLQLGDFTYPDKTYSDFFSKDYQNVVSSYHDKYSFPGIADFLRTTPIDYIYDDHDYTDNNSGRISASDDSIFYVGTDVSNSIFEIPLPPNARRNSILGYNNLFPAYPLVDTSEGLFHSFRFANVEIIFLDNRSARSPNREAFKYDSTNINMPWSFDPPATHSILGQVQMQWLKDKLQNSTADWKFIVSGTTFNRKLWKLLAIGVGLQKMELSIGDTDGTGISLATGFADGWPGFPADRDTLINFVRSNNIRNVIILTGDTHTAAMDDGTNSGLPEFNCSAMSPSSKTLMLYRLVDSVGQALLHQPPVLDSLWNQGGLGLGNKINSYSFGKVEIFGSDSVKMCIIEKSGIVVDCWTMKDGFVASLPRPEDDLLDSRYLSLYPNPADNEITVEISGEKFAAGDISYFILDSSGRILKQRQQDIGGGTFNINTSALPAGSYILSVKAGKTPMNKIFSVVR